MKKYLKDIFKFKQALPVSLLIIGLPLFIICSFGCFGLEQYNRHWFKFLDGISNVIVMSALVSFLIDSVEFMGVFKRALEDIIYDSKFLQKRKDIEDIWKKVSKELFNSKFPQISNSLMTAVKKYYSPGDGLKLTYYNDYINIYTLSLDKNNKNYLHVENEISFTVNVEDKDEFTFPMKTWICASEANKEMATLKFESVMVNGKEEKIELKDPIYENGMLRYDFSLRLGGCTEYKINQVIHKSQNLQEDNYIGFFARWLIQSMRVQVFYPEELDILFINRGVMGKYDEKKRKGYKEYEYKGLILKKQGYILTIIQKAKQETMGKTKISGDAEI